MASRAAAALLFIVLAAGPAPAADPLAGVEDLDGRPVESLLPAGAPAAVLLFLRADCPISNRYAPEVAALATRFRERHVAFWLVYPDPETTPAAIRTHLAEHALDAPELHAVRDPHHGLVALAKARVTPEAALLRDDGTLAYHGRIDDRYATLGRPRPAATRHDLAVALEELLAGRSVTTAESPAVGCALADIAR